MPEGVKPSHVVAVVAGCRPGRENPLQPRSDDLPDLRSAFAAAGEPASLVTGALAECALHNMVRRVPVLHRFEEMARYELV